MVIFRAFFSSPGTLNLKKKSRKSTNEKNSGLIGLEKTIGGLFESGCFTVYRVKRDVKDT